MPFSFFNPWLLLGALGIAAPLWLHLRRRKQANLTRFSAVRFLEDQPQPRQGPLHLQHLPLLLLRLLALLLVVAAFAWPYLHGGSPAPVRESRVYILDNTLSHQANNGFAQDRERLASELDQADRGVQIAVIELASSPRVIAGFGEDRHLAREKVEALEASFQRGSYLAAFRQANTLLANSLGEQKRIVFLGDSQENQWSENVSAPPFLRNIEVEIPKPAVSLRPNLSLAEPEAQRIFLGDKSLIHFTVKLGHTGPAREARVVVRANGKVVLNRTVGLEQQPETIVVQGQWEASAREWLQGEAVVEGAPDVLPGDNRVFFSVAPVVEGQVALLAQSPWLRIALSPDIMRGQWATRILEPARLGAELSSGRRADVLVIESSYLQSVDARKLLADYLKNGRGVLLLANRVTPTISGCLRELGFETEGVVGGGERSEAFRFVFSNHRIFHAFASPDYGNLMEVRVSQYVRLRAPQAMPLIFSEGGVPLFFQSQRMQGKLFLAAFGLDREHTSWPIHQTFIPFLDLTLQAARAENATPPASEPGEMNVIQLPAGAAAHEVVLREGKRELERAKVEQGRARLRMPERPGLYSLSYDQGEATERLLSVNPSPKESQLVYVENPKTAKAWQLKDAARTKPVAAGISAAGGLNSVLNQRLWWWMVIAGLSLLLLEMVLAEARKESA